MAAVLAVVPSTSTKPTDTLHDKTLVVWVAPANLTQRGGSALTIEDRRDHFDAIVLGERAEGRWMAGSDMFSRTLLDQTSIPPETAAPGKLVQIAIVYRANLVSVYRNGQPISQYTVQQPRDFGPESMVLFGRRHRKQGDNARFGGEIDDARIYDVALNPEQLQALRPNMASTPAPWAWWTFDEASGRDRTGRFPVAQLTGGAKIQRGRLILDGKDGSMLCKTGIDPPFAPETPAMPAHVPSSWLTYHLAHPGPDPAMPGDPNCAFFWKGRYHLHYIYNNKDGFSFAHVSSTDMVHWKWHPTTLTPPTTEHGMFSGTGFYTNEGRPAIIYHGQGSGRNQIQIALDDELEKWSKPVALEPKILPGQDPSLIAHWDPDAWQYGSNYYALSGGTPGSGKPATLFRSKDLKSWDYLGLFIDRDMPDVQKDEDISCPNFFKIGDKWMLLCISHNKGCRYYLGEWKNEKFVPAFHARMNWRGWDFFAPESLLTPDGRRVMWAWCHINPDGKLPVQTGIQSLPRELSLPKDGILRIKPLRELERLRYDEKFDRSITVRDGIPLPLDGIAGDALEIKLVYLPGDGKRGLRVYCDREGKGGFPITVDASAGTLNLGEMKVPFALKPNEELTLRVFIDKSMIEVFANDRQAAVAAVKYDPANVGVALISDGAESWVTEVRAWKMRSIYGP
jgi:beta-fructofuranosidase